MPSFVFSAGAIQVHNHVPEPVVQGATVNFAEGAFKGGDVHQGDIHFESPVNNVHPAPVTVNNLPAPATEQTIERNAEGEMVRITTVPIERPNEG